ncbi:hypothetical protein EPHNCH_1478 [Anaplasma phagocytophilum str. NCH-1]|uniref:Uncharacterized protein n=1 Tax=Anaplasma phagocytophilum str. NCH-1 TaxID=1359161 RepID=A0A0F3N533_ANAPH|nr:hypothetical protein EPHNCH_1478 [Anaplasma phagocytophilum str. NCH-1]
MSGIRSELYAKIKSSPGYPYVALAGIGVYNVLSCYTSRNTIGNI